MRRLRWAEKTDILNMKRHFKISLIISNNNNNNKQLCLKCQ